MKAVLLLILAVGARGFGGALPHDASAFAADITLGASVDAIPQRHFSYTSGDGGFAANITLAGDSVHVTVTGAVEASKWIGIAFNDKPSMPGGDYVVGWVTEDGTASVKDYYTPDCPCGPTPDHAIPTADASQDLTDVSASRQDGKTTMKFSRKLDTGDAHDNVIDPSKSYILFAWGGGYDAAGGVLTSEPASVMSFYTTMHGYMTTRDAKEMSCLEVGAGATCQAVPTNALTGDVGPALPAVTRQSLSAGSYLYEHYTKTFRAHFYPQGDSLKVTLMASIDPTKQWAALGFNDIGLMQGADVFVAWMDSDGQVQFGDYSIADYKGSHDTPVADAQNDYNDVVGAYKDGVFTVSFTRLLDTKDSQDKVIDMENTVVLAAWAGVLDSGTFKVSTGFDNSQWGFRHTMENRASVPWTKMASN